MSESRPVDPGTGRVHAAEREEVMAVIEDRPLYALEADAFAAAVQGKAPPWIAPEDTLGNLRLLDVLREQAGVPVPA